MACARRAWAEFLLATEQSAVAARSKARGLILDVNRTLIAHVLSQWLKLHMDYGCRP